MVKQGSTIYLMGAGLFAGLLLASVVVDRVLFMPVVALMLLMHVVGHGDAHLATAPSKDEVVRR